MPNSRAILAVAGGRKTQTIVDECAQIPDRQQLVLTFTRNGQAMLKARLHQACPAETMPDVAGWFSFLISHVVKPYLPDVFPGARITGLHFVEGEDPARGWTDQRRFFDAEGRVYHNHLAELARRILNSSESAVMDRLRRIYDDIFVDEVQDLTGYDLDILNALLKSGIAITLVGDLRQRILATARGSNRNQRFKDFNLLEWFEDQEGRGLLRIEHRTKSWRCNQAICDLADSIVGLFAQFPKTVSAMDTETGHDGIFFVNAASASDYIREHGPTVIRYNKNSKVPPDAAALNIGQVKGETFERVILFLPDTMTGYLRGEKSTLAPKSAAQLYVAVTRAMHSVAVVLP